METFNTVVFWLRGHSIIFMISVFTLITISAYWPGKRAEMEHCASIPLRDDE